MRICNRYAARIMLRKPTPSGDNAAICLLDPTTVPKVMDTITPPGVSQAMELDPTRGAVELQGVTVP